MSAFVVAPSIVSAAFASTVKALAETSVFLIMRFNPVIDAAAGKVKVHAPPQSIH
jgi:hypothetical protein